MIMIEALLQVSLRKVNYLPYHLSKIRGSATLNILD